MTFSPKLVLSVPIPTGSPTSPARISLVPGLPVLPALTPSGQKEASSRGGHRRVPGDQPSCSHYHLSFMCLLHSLDSNSASGPLHLFQPKLFLVQELVGSCSLPLLKLFRSARYLSYTPGLTILMCCPRDLRFVLGARVGKDYSKSTR